MKLCSQTIINCVNFVYCGKEHWDIEIVPYKTLSGWFHCWILSKETRLSNLLKRLMAEHISWTNFQFVLLFQILMLIQPQTIITTLILFIVVKEFGIYKFFLIKLTVDVFTVVSCLREQDCIICIKFALKSIAQCTLLATCANNLVSWLVQMQVKMIQLNTANNFSRQFKSKKLNNIEFSN